MKIRTGFVSNSSSSSFVLIVDKELHDKVLPTLHPYVQAVVNAAMEETGALGHPVMVHHDLDTMDGHSYVWEDFHVEYDGEPLMVKHSWSDHETEVEPQEAFMEFYNEAIDDAKQDSPDGVFTSRMG